MSNEAPEKGEYKYNISLSVSTKSTRFNADEERITLTVRSDHHEEFDDLKKIWETYQTKIMETGEMMMATADAVVEGESQLQKRRQAEDEEQKN